MNNRRTTVHDLTALSLHPTGSRAQPYHTNALKDVRGNWIAADAGGWGAVPKRRIVGDVESGDVEEGREDLEDGKERKRRGKVKKEGDGRNLKDRRAHKRRKLVQDIDFMHDNIPVTHPAEGDGDSPLELSAPSSDLLKQIHYFASHYYASQNILFDSSGEYREERKKRKEKKMRAAAGSVDGDEEPLSPGRDEREDTEREDTEGEEEEEEEESTEDDYTPGPSKKRSQKNTKNAKSKKKEQKQTYLRRNMYKAFDGSVLMVLGMLLQHHTASLVDPDVPEGWEEEMTFGVGERPRGGMKKKGTQRERGRGIKEESEEEREGNRSGSGEEGSGENDGAEDEMSSGSESDSSSEEDEDEPDEQ